MSNNQTGFITQRIAQNARKNLLEVIPTPKDFDYQKSHHRNELRKAFCITSGTPYSAIPEEFFNISEYEQTHYGINNYINVLDLTDNLLSTFAYMPEIMENKEAFVFTNIKMGNKCEIPIRDFKGEIIWRAKDWTDNLELEARVTGKPPVVFVNHIKTPACVTTNDGFIFDYNSGAETYDERSKQYIPDYKVNSLDSITNGTKKRTVGTLNPTHCFYLKNQLRLDLKAREGQARPVKEFITIRFSEAIPERRNEYGAIINDYIKPVDKVYMIEHFRDDRGNYLPSVSVGVYSNMNENLRTIVGFDASVDNTDANQIFSMAQRLAKSNNPQDKIKLKQLNSMFSQTLNGVENVVEKVVEKTAENDYMKMLLEENEEEAKEVVVNNLEESPISKTKEEYMSDILDIEVKPKSVKRVIKKTKK